MHLSWVWFILQNISVQDLHEDIYGIVLKDALK